jgi:carboxyl-terminal processing protease
MFRRRRSRSSLLPQIAALVLVLLAGIWMGGHPSSLPSFLRDRLVGDEDTRVVGEAINRVHESYYRPITKRALADDAIRGIVDGLADRFSQYLDPLEYQHLRLFEKAEFSGVGMSVLKAPLGLRVAEVFENSPARRAGIWPGDIIVAADGKPLKGRSDRSAVALIKGPPGSHVRLTFRRGGRERTVTVVRQRVTVPVVTSRVRRAGGMLAGVIKLSEFSSGAHAELDDALRRLLDRRARGVVLDLRGNGGGLVKEAQLVAGAFLRGGPVVTTRGRHVPNRTLEASENPIAPRLPLVVLVDRATASASEIVAGALQDRDRAVVVGTHTFGKGVFQELIQLSNGGALDITAGQYFTPTGRNLGGRGVRTGQGITPDVPARDDPRTQRDEALARALGVLTARLRK